ncbi:MAG: hypothetical protein NTW84_06085 [Methanothrix sp.]|nr:hypothetical protein [Methanothrix sp.]
MEPPLKSSPSKRPFGVSVIVLLIAAYILFTASVFYLSIKSQDSSISAQLVQIMNPTEIRAVLVAELIILLAIAIGLWRLRQWAWFLLMIWVGIQMFFDLMDYFYGHHIHASMLISVIIVFYINQREVKKAFSGKTLAGAKWTI